MNQLWSGLYIRSNVYTYVTERNEINNILFLRAINKYWFKLNCWIIYTKLSRKRHPSELCTLCELGSSEDEVHLLLLCPLYQDLGLHYVLFRLAILAFQASQSNGNELCAKSLGEKIFLDVAQSKRRFDLQVKYILYVCIIYN